MIAGDIEKPTSEQIQQALQNAGLYEGKIDGVIGPKSRKAIEDFQAQNNLTVDGKVGSRTWAKLQGYLNQPAPVESPSFAAQPVAPEFEVTAPVGD